MNDRKDVEAEFYYDEGGKKVQLTRDPALYAVRFRPGKRSDDPSLSERTRRFVRNESEHIDFVPNYNLQVYQSRLRSANEIRRELRAVNIEDSIEYAYPVFQRSADPADRVFVTNRFLVEFKPQVSEDEAQQLIQQLNAKYDARIVEQLGYTLPSIGFLLEAPAGDGEKGPFELSRHYFEESEGRLEYAVPDLIQRRVFRSTTAPESEERSTRSTAAASPRSAWTYESEQWYLASAKVTNAWHALSLRGNPEIKIAVADDGVDVEHPEFTGKVVMQFDFANNTADGRPKLSIDKHGTACAGVATARGVEAFGAAPDCSLIAVRLPDMLGVADEARMFEWLTDNGADVISCSWGPPDGTGAVYPLPGNIRSAIRYCVVSGRGGKGIPIFWAAGNGDESVSNDGYAANPDIMAIAASTDRDTKAYYSDHGPEIFLCAPSSGSRDQGEKRVFTTDRRGPSGYNPGGSTDLGDVAGLYTNDFGGTSAAAPLAAGIAGLLLSANPALSRDDVRDILKQTADPIGGGYDANGHSHVFGFGKVNALGAVEEARNRAGATDNTEPPFVSGEPSISGPESLSRSESPPIFHVDPSPNTKYAVEVTTRPELFNNEVNGAERNSSNFYASWSEPGPLLSSSVYALLKSVWDRLKESDRIYYRIWTSSSATGWENRQTSTRDNESDTAPFIIVQDDGAQQVGPSISGPESLSRSASPPAFNVDPSPNTFYAVEVATRADLFNNAAHGAERDRDNFYASWSEAVPLVSNTTYTLPSGVWSRLKSAQQVYYRIWTSANASEWANRDTTVTDAHAAQAPFIQILNTQRTDQSEDDLTRIEGIGTRTATALKSVGIGSYEELAALSDEELRNYLSSLDIRPASNVSIWRDQAHLAAREDWTGLDALRKRMKKGRPASDYLTRIEGIGPKISEALMKAGISSYSDLAEAGHEKLTEALQSAGIRQPASLPTWTEQAALVASGELADLEALQASLAGGRAPSTVRVMRDVVALPVFAITAPESYPRDTSEPPKFSIWSGTNRWFAVEVATQPELFDQANHQDDRDDNNFYASWHHGSLVEASGSATFELPVWAWATLGSAARLYYRLWTSASRSDWVNRQTTLPDQNAVGGPFIQLTGVSTITRTRRHRDDEARWRTEPTSN